MELLKFLRYQNAAAVVCLFLTLRIGRTSALQLCHHGQETTNLTNLNMTSSPISDSYGMCSCRIHLIDDAKLQMFPDISVPLCSTRVALSSYNFTCVNQNIAHFISYAIEKKAGDVLWLFVTSTNISQVMTGNLQIKTSPTSSRFILECFDANSNTSVTTSSPATTTTTSTKTTAASPTTTAPTKNVHVSITTTKSPPMAESAIPSVTTSSSYGPPVSASESAPANSPSTDDKVKEFPVAAVAGGIAGGLLLIIIVTLAVVCFRRRNREPKLLENGGQPSTDQGYNNRAYDSGMPTMGDMKPQDTQSSDNIKHVHVENDLYASADTDNQPRHSRVNLTDSVAGHYASPGDLNIDKSEVESVEGSEVVITSSGDLYAVVDESKKHQDQLVIGTNPTASPPDLYAVVDKSKKHKNELLFHPNPTQDNEYAVVNKKQDPQDIDPTSMVSPSGDVYAVVNKKQDPQDLDTTHTFSPSGDVYAVVDKKQDPQVLDPNHMTSPSGDVYAVVDKNPEADPNDQMTATYDDDEEEAIRRVMDMSDERPSSDTLQSTSL